VADSDGNGIGICDWPQWSNLTKEQQEYEMHRNLKLLNAQMRNVQHTIRIYAGLGGLMGGAISVFTIYGLKLAF